MVTKLSRLPRGRLPLPEPFGIISLSSLPNGEIEDFNLGAGFENDFMGPC